MTAAEDRAELVRQKDLESFPARLGAAVAADTARAVAEALQEGAFKDGSTNLRPYQECAVAAALGQPEGAFKTALRENKMLHAAGQWLSTREGRSIPRCNWSQLINDRHLINCVRIVEMRWFDFVRKFPAETRGMSIREAFPNYDQLIAEVGLRHLGDLLMYGPLASCVDARKLLSYRGPFKEGTKVVLTGKVLPQGFTPGNYYIVQPPAVPAVRAGRVWNKALKMWEGEEIEPVPYFDTTSRADRETLITEILGPGPEPSAGVRAAANTLVKVMSFGQIGFEKALELAPDELLFVLGESPFPRARAVARAVYCTRKSKPLILRTDEENLT